MRFAAKSYSCSLFYLRAARPAITHHFSSNRPEEIAHSGEDQTINVMRGRSSDGGDVLRSMAHSGDSRRNTRMPMVLVIMHAQYGKDSVNNNIGSKHLLIKTGILRCGHLG
jgi:hypothetical protein